MSSGNVTRGILESQRLNLEMRRKKVLEEEKKEKERLHEERAKAFGERRTNKIINKSVLFVASGQLFRPFLSL